MKEKKENRPHCAIWHCAICGHEKCPVCGECHNSECHFFLRPFDKCYALLSTAMPNPTQSPHVCEEDLQGYCYTCHRNMLTQSPEGWAEKVNVFIKKWCGENAPHLLDTDDNDGQELRNLLASQLEEIREKVAAKKKNITWHHDTCTPVCGYNEAIEDIIALLSDKVKEEK